MKLAALVEAEDHVCCRYRLAAFRSHFEAAGHTLELHPIPKSWYGRLTLGGFEADAIILQRKLLPRVPFALLRQRAKRLIFDFDDAVWLRDSHSLKGFDDPRRARRFRRTAAACDLVVAGNETLAAEAGRFSNHVAVIPTCVDCDRLPVRDCNREHASEIRMVWVGSSSTLRGLEPFAPTLSAIGRAVPNLRFKIICDRFIDVRGLPVDRCVWKEATEADEIAAADIGIGWVPDDPWSRGKCGLKVLQYQAAGLPVVANPVGVQADFVRDGITGFQATTPEQWVNAIRELAASAELRRTLGAAGRRQVEARYSVAAGAKLWLDALQVLSRRAA